MADMYIGRAELEKCRADKHVVNCIHTRVGIHYVLSGKGYFSGRQLCAGQGFVCHRNHNPEYYPDREDPWTYLWFGIEGNNDKITDMLSEIGLCTPPYTFSFDWGYKLLRYVDEYFTDGVYVTKNEMHSEGLIKMILSEHLEKKAQKNETSQRKTHCEEAKKYMQNNFHKRLTVEDVANHLCLSRAYLRNIFHQYNGLSPQQYLISLRIERAKELLQIGSFSVSSIAHSVGFSDVLVFSKFFKTHTGASPSDYKKKYLDSHSTNK